MKLASGDVDVHVGQRMRRRREALGKSQGRLGREMGVQHAQIQKWEKGENRIGAGRLYQIADIFGVTPNWFYEGLEPPAPVRRRQTRQVCRTRCGRSWMRSWPFTIPTPAFRSSRWSDPWWVAEDGGHHRSAG